MSKKIEYLQEIHNFQFKYQNSIGICHLELITDVLFKLTRSLYEYKVKVAYHLTELDGKYFRFGLTNHSLMILLKENSFKLLDNDVKIYDIFSLKSLTRMQIESFLIMFYLFFDKVNAEEKNFRYDVYKIHALKKQLGLEIENVTDELKEKKQRIQNELNQAIENIQKSSFYKNATERQKEEFLNPKYPKLISSKEVFESSGISKFNLIWQIFSNNVHAEHISDRQFNWVYIEKKSFIEDVNLNLLINLILTSKLIENISINFDVAKKEYQKFGEKEKTIIETWAKLNLKTRTNKC